MPLNELASLMKADYEKLAALVKASGRKDADLPFPRALPIKTTDEFGAYARRIYASLGLGPSA
jgi:hypothetical protein